MLLPAAHPTSLLSCSPHPPNSLAARHPHPPNPFYPWFRRVRHAQDVSFKNLCLVLVLAIRSTWSWAPLPRPPWCLLLTCADVSPPPPSLPRCTNRRQLHKQQPRPALEVEDLLRIVRILPPWSSLQRCKWEEMVLAFMELQPLSVTFWKTSPSCGC
jgi:hypothetical protein